MFEIADFASFITVPNDVLEIIAISISLVYIQRYYSKVWDIETNKKVWDTVIFFFFGGGGGVVDGDIYNLARSRMSHHHV